MVAALILQPDLGQCKVPVETAVQEVLSEATADAVRKVAPAVSAVQ